MSTTPATAQAVPKSAVEKLKGEIARFGVVGVVAYIVDVGVFNLLTSTDALLSDKVLTAKIISTTLATIVAYVGNRHWTFAHRPKGVRWKEWALFIGANIVAMLLAVGVLALTHYVFGWTSPLADNISANIFGVGAGTVFRFWAYRTFVFPTHHQTSPELAEQFMFEPAEDDPTK